MLKRLAVFSYPCNFKSLSSKTLLPYCNFNYNSPPPDQAWKIFPYIPFFSGNTKLGLFIGIPALAGYLVPNEIIFDVIAATATLATIPLDKKFLSMNPHNPPEKLYGRELTPKFMSHVCYGISCLLSFGLLGQNYLLSTGFTLAGYLAFMGVYRLSTQFLPPESLTKSKVTLMGSALSSALLYAFTDLSDITDGPIMDLTQIMLPVYLGYSYLAGTQIMKVHDDSARAMTVEPIAIPDPEADRLEGVMNQLEAWKMDHYITRFLIVYKWINIGAYLILLSVIGVSKSFGVKEQLEESYKRPNSESYE